MKIIYGRIIPFKGFVAIMLFGVIFARSEYKPISETVINHEKIHSAQAKDCGGWIWFYFKYLYYYFKYGYRNNPFEREAYINQGCSDYLKRYRIKNAYKLYKI